MAKKFTLGKTERLKSRKAIDALFDKGNSFNVSPFRVIYQVADESGLQFGVGVSTRNFKKAVDRNRIKRQVKEAYRLQKLPLQEWLRSQKKGMHVFFTYTGKEIPDYAIVSAIVQKCLHKLMSKLETTTPDT